MGNCVKQYKGYVYQENHISIRKWKYRACEVVKHICLTIGPNSNFDFTHHIDDILLFQVNECLENIKIKKPTDGKVFQYLLKTFSDAGIQDISTSISITVNLRKWLMMRMMMKATNI